MKKRPVEGHSSFSATLPHKNPAWPFLAALSASGGQCAALPYPSVTPLTIIGDKATRIAKQVTRYTPHAPSNTLHKTMLTKPAPRSRRHETRHNGHVTLHNRPDTRYADGARHKVPDTEDTTHATRCKRQNTRDTKHGTVDKGHRTMVKTRNTGHVTSNTSQKTKSK